MPPSPLCGVVDAAMIDRIACKVQHDNGAPPVSQAVWEAYDQVYGQAEAAQARHPDAVCSSKQP